MGSRYTDKTVTGYNSAPPPDDGSLTLNNMITWSGIRTKLTNPILTLIQDMNTALVNALNFSGRSVGTADVATSADHMKTIECTGTFTCSLPVAATVGEGFTIGYKNLGAGTITIDLANATDTLEGVVDGTATLAPGAFILIKLLVGASGYYIESSSVSLTSTNSTNTDNIAITDDTTTAAEMYLTWVTAGTGDLPAKVSTTKLHFNPSTGVLTADGFTGAFTGNLTGNSDSSTNSTNTDNIAITDDTTTNAEVFLTWVDTNSGDNPTKVTSTKLHFNPSTGVLTSTGGFAGVISGTADNANGLNTTTSPVVVSGAAAPTAGQVLTAIDATTASWQTPATPSTAANSLNTTTDPVVVSGAAAPTAGQVLTAIDATTAEWQTPTVYGTGDVSLNSFASLDQGFRLTLESGNPAAPEVAGLKTTIYCSPYKGNTISLFNGTSWDSVSSAEFSVALGTLTANIGYDVFCYNNAGTPTLELLAWASASARATALVRQNGVLCKSGDLTRRYLGSFYTISTTQTADLPAGRLLWNYDHRLETKINVSDVSATPWSYSGGVRIANANTDNQIFVFVGLVEDNVKAQLSVMSELTAGSGYSGGFIGFNSMTDIEGDETCSNSLDQVGISTCTASLNAPPSLGFNYIAWLEYTTTGSTYDFINRSNVTLPYYQNGLTGSIFR